MFSEGIAPLRLLAVQSLDNARHYFLLSIGMLFLAFPSSQRNKASLRDLFEWGLSCLRLPPNFCKIGFNTSSKLPC
ncbi:hypothetical protein ACFX19_041045 [Malus domestica]